MFVRQFILLDYLSPEHQQNHNILMMKTISSIVHVGIIDTLDLYITASWVADGRQCFSWLLCHGDGVSDVKLSYMCHSTLHTVTLSHCYI